MRSGEGEEAMSFRRSLRVLWLQGWRAQVCSFWGITFFVELKCIDTLVFPTTPSPAAATAPTTSAPRRRVRRDAPLERR